MVRVGWKRRSRPLGYTPDDILDEAIVYAANQDYFNMFGLSLSAENFRPQDHLSLAKLLTNLKELDCVDPPNMQRLENDQARLFRDIVLNSGFARSGVPIVFNDKHPRREFRASAYLPTLVAMRTTGSPESQETRPHFSYFIVVFIEQPIPEVI
ncbi:MAG: hypothetical protein MZW92_71715 [Comamonadaceae bacterium]|nr:hypothetical protein [Comamonadaceae bacterium]